MGRSCATVDHCHRARFGIIIIIAIMPNESSYQYFSTNKGIRTSLYQWGICDVAFGHFTRPEKCKSINCTAPSGQIAHCKNNTELENNLRLAVDDLSAGFGLSMVYHDGIDSIGHEYGPDHEIVCES